MSDDAYERLLNFLASNDEPVSSLDEEVVEQMVTDAASLLSDLRSSADDLAGAAVWKQVAVDTSQLALAGSLEIPELWLNSCNDNQDEWKTT